MVQKTGIHGFARLGLGRVKGWQSERGKLGGERVEPPPSPRARATDPIITLSYNNKLPTDLISTNAVYLKILIQKVFKLI